MDTSISLRRGKETIKNGRRREIPVWKRGEKGKKGFRIRYGGDRREAQRARRMNGNMQLLEVRVGIFSRKSQRPRGHG